MNKKIYQYVGANGRQIAARKRTKARMSTPDWVGVCALTAW